MGYESERLDLKDDVHHYRVSTISLFTDLLPRSLLDAALQQGRYETMVFRIKPGGEVNYNSLYTARYETVDEAVKGHGEVVAHIKENGLDGLEDR